MASVTLTEVKLHLRITDDDEDSILAIYMSAADDYMRKYLNRSIPGENESPANIPSAIKAAALLFIGDLYDNRGGGAGVNGGNDLKENPTLKSLLYPYREEIGI